MASANKEILYAYAQDAEECERQKELCRQDGYEPIVYCKVKKIGNKKIRYEVRGICRANATA